MARGWGKTQIADSSKRGAVSGIEKLRAEVTDRALRRLDFKADTARRYRDAPVSFVAKNLAFVEQR